MDVVILKIILMLVMLLLTVAFGLAPLKVLKILRKRASVAAGASFDLTQQRWPSLVLCLLSCFTGGVFLAACFLHLLPEVRQHMDKIQDNYHWDIDYPMPELISCFGFFLVFFIEELVLLLLRNSGQKHEHNHSRSRRTTGGDCHDHDSCADEKNVIATITSGEKVPEDVCCHKPLNEGADEGCYESPSAHHDAAHLFNNPHMKSSSSPVAAVELSAEPECCEGPCDGQDEHPPIRMVARPHAHHHGVRSITLVVALSFHSVIEGLAFGISATSEQATALFLSIIFHKCIVAFSVGLQLARTHAHRLSMVVVSIVLLALMSPVGTIIGIVVEQSNIDSELKLVIITVFEGLSVGTFLYVTFFEVFIHERDNEHPNLLKLLVTIIGFALIAAVRTMDHDHDD